MRIEAMQETRQDQHFEVQLLALKFPFLRFIPVIAILHLFNHGLYSFVPRLRISLSEFKKKQRLSFSRRLDVLTIDWIGKSDVTIQASILGCFSI